MHSTIARLRCKFLFGLWFTVSLTAIPSLAQSSAHPSPVEVVTPKPPTPVMVEGRLVLVYELHITNFASSPMKLTEIQVFAVADKTVPTGVMGSDKLADYTGSSLAELLHPVGEPMQMGATSKKATRRDTSRLDGGRRVIAFMYVSIAPDLHVSALRHRFLFDVSDPSYAKGTPNDESALDGVMVPVSQQEPPVLRPPLSQGIWLAGNGTSNTSAHRRAVIALNGRPYIAQRFGADWMLVGPNGNTFHDSRARNENFWDFGQPVLAVADGEVTEVVDDIPDHLPDQTPEITLKNVAGNHVILRIAPGIYAMFAHLKQGSIRLRLHQQVKAGDVLGELGDSGNTTAPHLHFQLMDANSPLAAEGIPYLFEKFRFLGFGRDFEMDKHPDEPRSLSLPMDDTVLSFR
jgi:hypothetical protein